jgi:hypothetical protein
MQTILITLRWGVMWTLQKGPNLAWPLTMNPATAVADAEKINRWVHSG